ncbi:MAG: alpha/beta hydrolase [Deltaproteobacteria bacterium]|nr:alpha/beta hydrolase [Deltaproteobacteria bacterium]
MTGTGNALQDRRAFLAVGAGCLSLAAFDLPAMAAEQGRQDEPEHRSLKLPSGRSMGYRTIGQGDTDLILVHGFPGSSRQFLSFEKFLTNSGLCALAPDLYGKKTDWQQRGSVLDAGEDIADLYLQVRGKERRPVVLCVSAGAKDGIAATIALNLKLQGKYVPALYVISGQMDLGRADTFGLLRADQQFEFNCIRGVSRRAVLRVIQPVRNLGANIRRSVAHRRVDRLSHDPEAAFRRIVGAMSITEDIPLLREDPEFRSNLRKEIAEYTGGEIIHSIHRLFNWDVDFRQLRGTPVTIVHGTKDSMVPHQNAEILRRELQRAGVEAVVKLYPDGHLLLKRRAEAIAANIKEGLRATDVGPFQDR